MMLSLLNGTPEESQAEASKAGAKELQPHTWHRARDKKRMDVCVDAWMPACMHGWMHAQKRAWSNRQKRWTPSSQESETSLVAPPQASSGSISSLVPKHSRDQHLHVYLAVLEVGHVWGNAMYVPKRSSVPPGWPGGQQLPGTVSLNCFLPPVGLSPTSSYHLAGGATVPGPLPVTATPHVLSSKSCLCP